MGGTGEEWLVAVIAFFRARTSYILIILLSTDSMYQASEELDIGLTWRETGVK